MIDPVSVPMTSSFTSEILVGILAGLAVLGIGMWKNRSDIKSIETSVFGHSDNGGGQSEAIEALSEDLEEISRKLDEAKANQEQHRHAVKSEIKTNRFMLTRSVGKIVEQINRQSDELDVEKPDIKPDNYDVGRHRFDASSNKEND